MPKTSKPNRPSSNDRTVPYATSTSLRPTTMDTSQPASTSATERSQASPWPEGEDRILMEARQKGLNWAAIASKHFPLKTPNACRKRHERLMDKRKSQDDWNVEELAQAYMEVREKMWQILASRLSENWQAVEGKCMEKGLKTLQNVSRNVARREKAVRDHRADSDDGSCHIDDQHPQQRHQHQHHHSRPHDRNRNGSDLGREEVMPSYRADGVPPLPPTDMSISTAVPPYRPSNRNSSSLSREELMHPYHGDDGAPLPPAADTSVSSARSPHTPHRTFSTAATTPTSYAPITVAAQGPSRVLPPMHSPHDSSPQLPSFNSIFRHPTPVTTH